MQNTKLVNRILGWIVFVIAAVTYFLTLEPTVSWWDCGEFITSAFKLEVGHPPGAPTFIILGRIFTLLGGGPERAAVMVNTMSALASAGTIMILYWTIVHLAYKLFPEEKLSLGEQIAVWGSGLVGALAFSFTDSFWFSAVEGEVYALSSFFTALVFWAILKWENVAHEKNANRWLVLIAYLVGLSIGVHLLNLLAIPAIGLVYYFKKYDFSWKGVIWALVVSMGILLGIQYGIIPGVAKIAFLFDRVFVNGFGLPFNSGILFLAALVIAGAVWGIRYTRQRNLVLWNNAITMLIVILIGYSSFALILIRASANPPMNQNYPDNAFALLRYINREQYGDRPLAYGPYYNAPRIGTSNPKDQYNKVDGEYKMTGTMPGKSEYEPKMETVFPRMYSDNANHIRAYKEWGKVKGTPVRVRERGEVKTLQKPTFGENLRFFFSYQLGHMYMRYFMWNFVGRQNDIQGHGEFDKGNWISGIEAFDRSKVGSTADLPDFMKNDASRNTYYFLPLIFGLLGMFYQYNQGRKGKETFTVTMLLFVLTGIAIVVYLNQYPFQPRERDYAYAGSFYAFAIWIGLGVLALHSAVKKVVKGSPGAVIVTVISLGLVPGILAAENWHDHDRSGRYMTRDYAKNYLESCAPNAILFTYGDNDTFPLWYVQEVEGVRPDIKIINVSYLGMDWYIYQQQFTTNDAPPVPFTFDRDKYYMGRMDAVLFQDRIKGSVELSEAMEFLGSDDVRTKVKVTSGDLMDYLPSKEFHITVDKQKAVESGTVKPEDADQIADRVTFKINKSMIGKSEMAVLNMIAANNWERPIYIDHSLVYTGNIHFLDWLQFEGLAYRFVPIQTKRQGIMTGRIDTDILYDNVMNKFVWGNVNDPDIHMDEYNRKQINIMQTRYMFARLAEALIRDGEKEKAIEVIDRLFELFPNSIIPLTYDSFPAVEQYYRAGAFDKANEVVRVMAQNSIDMLNYYTSLPANLAASIEGEQNRQISQLRNLVIITRNYNQDELNKEIDEKLQELINKLQS
ncbi:protein O-mannosyl-transferase family [Maribellus mangrovi]|uniref:protein O-mannosyl-transferase family n=1 Tax=Maribellus mangrovi TaxID=3133146 RepID=UPI0030EE8B21